MTSLDPHFPEAGMVVRLPGWRIDLGDREVLEVRAATGETQACVVWQHPGHTKPRKPYLCTLHHWREICNRAHAVVVRSPGPPA